MTQQEYENQLNAAYGNNDYQTVHKLGQAMVREGMPIGSYYMASASNSLGSYSQATKEIDQYLASNSNADGWFLKGNIELANNNYYAAYQAYDRAAAMGHNNSLGYAALSKFIYAKDHMNDDPDNVQLSSEIFGLMEQSIIDAATCIQKNANDFEFYQTLPAMLFTDYSMITAGRTIATTITTTKTTKNQWGGIEDTSTDSFTVHGSWSTSGSLWDMHNAIKQGEATTQNQAAAAFRRAMRLANVIDDAGRKADAAMTRFGMIYAEITLNGQRGVAQDAVWFYQYGLDQAMNSMSEDAFGEWFSDYSAVRDDYTELMKKFGNQIKRAQESGQQPNFIRYYLDENRIPVGTKNYLQGGLTNLDLQSYGGNSDKTDWRAIPAAIGNADILALAPTVGGGLIASAARGFHPLVTWVFFFFGLIVFGIGLSKSSSKIPADGERKTHRIAQLALFVLFLINFFLGLIGLAVCKVVFRTKQ